jgi:hypothetical protein
MKAFVAIWLGLLTESHIQAEIVQNQKEGMFNFPQKGKKYLRLVDIFKIGWVTRNEHRFFFGLIIVKSFLS